MLYLTYKTEEKKDGLGAQYQRIIGIIALSKILNCEYVHSPITSIEHCVDAKESEDFFNINKIYKNVDQIKYDQIIDILYPTESQLEKIKEQKQNTLVRIFLPFGIIEGWDDNKNYMEIYDEIMPVLRPLISKKQLRFDEKSRNISIHIRRGDVTIKSYPKRYVPIDFYKKLIEKLKKIYENYQIHIFTEIKKNLNEFDYFKNQNIKIHANENVFESFYNLTKSDVLVTAPSSFSILAGLYNTSKVFYIEKTLFNNRKHKKISRWELLPFDN